MSLSTLVVIETLFPVFASVVASRQLWREPRPFFDDVAAECDLHARDASGAINQVAQVSFSVLRGVGG